MHTHMHTRANTHTHTHTHTHTLHTLCENTKTVVLYRQADVRGAAGATKGAAHEAPSCVPEAERDLASLVEPQVRQR